MRHGLTVMMVVCLLSLSVLAQTPTTQSKAEEILSQARAAIGDEAKRKSLHSLSASGILRQMVGNQPMESELKYDILLPNRFRRSDSRAPFTTITTIEDDRIQLRRVPVSAVVGTRSDEDEIAESKHPEIQARRQAVRRADFARLLLGWVLMPPPSLPVEYNYIGVARGTNRTADVIEVKGPDGFTARLIIDQNTHRLLVLAWRGKKLSEVARMLGSTADEIDDQGDQPPAQTGPTTPQTEGDKRQKEFAAAMAKAPEVRFRWVFSDYKNVDGLNLPHRLVKAEDGVMKEEWEIRQFQVNPRLTAEMFAVKEKK